MSDLQVEMLVDEGIPVTLPSGSHFHVLTSSEASYVAEKIERYLEDNSFQNISDLQDIDRLITMELMYWRWSMWVSKQRDYWGNDVSVVLGDRCREYSVEIRQLKKLLGVDKVARDRTQGDDSVAARWKKILERAKAFGYNRNNQAIKAIECMHRVAALITTYENMDEEEQIEFGFTVDEVIADIKETVEDYRQIDEDFRFGVQQYWVADQ